MNDSPEKETGWTLGADFIRQRLAALEAEVPAASAFKNEAPEPAAAKAAPPASPKP